MTTIFAALLLSLTACGPTDENTPKTTDTSEGTPTDTSADSATDSGADTATDSGGGGGGQGDVSTYEGFVQTHARTYCASLETCEYLDEQGYADRAGCVNSITTRLGAADCATYDENAGRRCVQQDREMASACADHPGGLPPTICRNVCAGGGGGGGGGGTDSGATGG